MHPKHPLTAVTLVLFLGGIFAGQAAGQCILANPSFELPGSYPAVFGGWNQFGVVGQIGEPYHGNAAARVSGPDYGGWDTSGYWQAQDCSPGEQWEITGHVRHPSGKPLTGASVALVNIEWRDSGENLLSYDSFSVADASSPTDEYIDFSVISSAAPAGTATARLLVGVLQSPDDPSPDVYYDQITFYSLTPPTIDDVQWNDFPGGNTLEFGGRTWRVKGPGWYGPGYNNFCDDPECVWVDSQGRLHLTLTKSGTVWRCTEVVTEESLGYGDYILTTVGPLQEIDPQMVLGIFLWEYGPCWSDSYLWWNAFNEVDIEYSYWGNPSSDLGQFVAQPYDYPGNINRFDTTFGADEVASHAMRWLADRVEYRVWRGGPDDESPGNLIRSWTYTGPHIPRPEQPRMHLNLWKLGTPAGDHEVIFQDFTFVPEGGASAVGEEIAAARPAIPSGRLFPATPNPFNPQTKVRFALDRGGSVQLDVYDLDGSLVRTLSSGYYPAGEHEATWDGRDDGGRPLASGVYFLRLVGSDFMETRQVALIK